MKIPFVHSLVVRTAQRATAVAVYNSISLVGVVNVLRFCARLNNTVTPEHHRAAVLNMIDTALRRPGEAAGYIHDARVGPVIKAIAEKVRANNAVAAPIATVADAVLRRTLPREEVAGFFTELQRLMDSRAVPAAA
jgi:hypothetical protein